MTLACLLFSETHVLIESVELVISLSHLLVDNSFLSLEISQLSL